MMVLHIDDPAMEAHITAQAKLFDKSPEAVLLQPFTIMHLGMPTVYDYDALQAQKRVMAA